MYYTNVTEAPRCFFNEKLTDFALCQENPFPDKIIIIKQILYIGSFSRLYIITIINELEKKNKLVFYEVPQGEGE